MGYDMFVKEDEERYFRLNIWGMEEYRHIMTELDMVDWDTPEPPWPAEDGIKSNRELRAQHEAKVQWAPDDPPAILGYKLCSNDGWLVTPAEITAALEQYKCWSPWDKAKVFKANSESWDPKYWRQWTTFLGYAANHGGFYVW